MTLHIVDVSRHQVERMDPLDLARAKSAGMGAVNVQLDRGKQQDMLPAWAPEYVAEARRLGLGISTYRWLDARVDGVTSARRAYDRIVTACGSPDGVAHIVDCEDNATERHLRDYVATMTGLLGRAVGIYSGRWWLQPRGWQVADLSPFLWAAPSAGYLPEYPGDGSRHWSAGYGGWTTLSVMQYSVKPLPGTGDCSLSAVRDPAVWAALTGRGSVVRATNMQVLTNETREEHPGVVVYGIGDDEHRLSPSDHNEDDTPGSRPEQEDADSNPEHRAIDVMIGPAFTDAQAEAYVQKLVTRPANRRRLKYVIYKRRIWRANGGWVQEVYTGTDPHTNHVHVSGLAANDEDGSAWDLADGDDMVDFGPADPNAWAQAVRIDALRLGSVSLPAAAGGGTMWINDQVRLLVNGQAASAQREASMIASIEALSALVQAGGGDVDSAAILARIDSQAEEVMALIEAKDAQIDALNAELARVLAAAAAQQ